MTDRIGDITKAVVYGIITAIGDDGSGDLKFLAKLQPVNNSGLIKVLR